MIENTVSASHFRVHFKEINNAVSEGGEVCRIERHGLPMTALVSLEDVEFLRRHKWGAKASGAEASGAKAMKWTDQAEAVGLDHPDTMPIELVKKAYALTEGSTDFVIQAWRAQAYLSIRVRTGKPPEDPRGDSPSG